MHHGRPLAHPGVFGRLHVADEAGRGGDGPRRLGLEVVDGAQGRALADGLGAEVVGLLLGVEGQGVVHVGHARVGRDDLGAAVVEEREGPDEGEGLGQVGLGQGLVLATVELVVGRGQLELAPEDPAQAVLVLEEGVGAVHRPGEEPGNRSGEDGDVGHGDGVARDPHVGGPAVAARGQGRARAAPCGRGAPGRGRRSGGRARPAAAGPGRRLAGAQGAPAPPGPPPLSAPA